MIGAGMYDVQVIDYGPRCIAMANETMYEGDTLSLDTFYREELIPIFAQNKACNVIVEDPNSECPVLQMQTDYLALSPNFFGKGYTLKSSCGQTRELTKEYWESYTGGVNPIIKQ